MTNDKNIKRYNVGYMGLEEHPKGRFVAHGDHVEVVKKLEAEIAFLRKGLKVVGEHTREMFVDGWHYGYNAIWEVAEENSKDGDRFLKAIEELKAKLDDVSQKRTLQILPERDIDYPD